MEFREIFPSFVAVGKLAGATELNPRLMAEVETVRARTPNSKPGGWACNLYTTFFNRAELHTELPGFRQLARGLLAHSREFAGYMGVDLAQVEPVIVECWLNVYRGTDTQEVHNHGGYHLSGVYYPKAPPGSGRINFYTPLVEDNFAQLPALHLSRKTEGIANVQPEDGTVVMFRSWMRHAVSPGTSEDDRVSVAFNVLLVPPDVARQNNAAIYRD